MPMKRATAKPRNQKRPGTLRDLSVTAKQLGKKRRPIMGGGKKVTLT